MENAQVSARRKMNPPPVEPSPGHHRLLPADPTSQPLPHGRDKYAALALYYTVPTHITSGPLSVTLSEHYLYLYFYVYNKLIRDTREAYIRTKFVACENDPKRLFKTIIGEINRKPHRQFDSQDLPEIGAKVPDHGQIDMVNEHFALACKKLAECTGVKNSGAKIRQFAHRSLWSECHIKVQSTISHLAAFKTLVEVLNIQLVCYLERNNVIHKY